MARYRIGAVLGVAAFVLGGCGGGGGSKPAAQMTTSEQSATTQAQTTQDTTTQAAATPAPAGGITPLGTTLKMGETAVIAYTDSSKHKQSRIAVTPQKIEKGSIADFKNIELDADQKKATPYYVTVHVKNVGKGDLSGTDPASYIDGLDDRGQEQNGVIFFGTFERCNSDDAKSLRPGESYSSCVTFLIPGGGSVEGMRWIAFDQKTGKANIDWK
jgi:hypothetical protein